MKKKYNFGKIVEVFDLVTDTYKMYQLPTEEEINKNYQETLDTQYDEEEKKEVRGGIPLIWRQV
jgi:sterol desaturase/sphingolipid hydroxylase (fatty acid hydroxylase superfamily)